MKTRKYIAATLLAVAAVVIPATGARMEKSPAAQQAAIFNQKLPKNQEILHALNRLTFGARPGDAEKPDDKPLDEAGAISAAATGSPAQVTSSAPPEINFVPSGRRDIVREYFRGPGEARNP